MKGLKSRIITRCISRFITQSLPGYYTTSDGCKIPQRIVANICEECEGRICNHLAKVVDIKEIEWCKASIHWLDEKGEKDG